MKMKFGPVDPADLPRFWPLIRPLIETVVAFESKVEPEEVYRLILAHDAQLWLAMDPTHIHGLVVTELVREAEGLECNIWLASGRMPQGWGAMLTTIERFAHDCGCRAINVAHGRPGWARALRHHHYHAADAVMLAKELH